MSVKRFSYYEMVLLLFYFSIIVLCIKICIEFLMVGYTVITNSQL